MKSLETADYFRAISDAYVVAINSSPEHLFPVRDFISPEEVERIESKEAEGEEDDGRSSIESFIEEAERTIGMEAGSKRLSVKREAPPTKHAIVQSAIPPTQAPQIEARPPVVSVAKIAPAKPAMAKIEEIPPAEAVPAGESLLAEETKISLAPYIPPSAFVEPAPEEAVGIQPQIEISVGAFAADSTPMRRRKTASAAKVDAGGHPMETRSCLAGHRSRGHGIGIPSLLQGHGSLPFHPGTAARAGCRGICAYIRTV